MNCTKCGHPKLTHDMTSPAKCGVVGCKCMGYSEPSMEAKVPGLFKQYPKDGDDGDEDDMKKKSRRR